MLRSFGVHFLPVAIGPVRVQQADRLMGTYRKTGFFKQEQSETWLLTKIQQFWLPERANNLVLFGLMLDRSCSPGNSLLRANFSPPPSSHRGVFQPDLV